MGLTEYVRKRRLGQTPEPGPGARARRGSKRPIFVVQLHHARARHYDFRLEVDGALKSWAVPKGPSLRPGEKRLAVEVEDHPLSYAAFEGDIPKGHYGAGHVDIFDRGVWSTDEDPRRALADGKLDFALHGERLRGSWTLVRTKLGGRQPQWLLIKRSDEEARDVEADDLVGAARPAKKSAARNRSAKAPARKRKAGSRWSSWHDLASALPGARERPLHAGFAPQLCIQQTAPPRGDDWLHETKFDGYRLLADLDEGRAKLRSRKNLDWTEKLSAIARAIEALPIASARIDGELVALDARGHSDFSRLQHALKSGAVATLRYMIFDLPALEGVDLTRAALIERKALLEKLLATSRQKQRLVYSSHVVGHGDKVFAAAGRAGLEGIVSKAVDAPYVEARASTWIKVKHANTDEFVVVGFSAPKGSRTGFGALLLATVEDGALRYVGRVGTGFDDQTLKALARRLKAIERKDPVLALPSHIPSRERSAHWVDPVLVAEIEFRGWAKEGLLRQGSFLRLRDDKSVEDLGLRATGRGRKAMRGTKENGA